MKKILALFSAFLLLTSCGDSSKIKDAVRLNLKDPESAQFQDPIFSADNKRACINYNAKNGFGGYGDWSIAELENGDSEWFVKNMEAEKKFCTQTGFEARDAGVKAEWDSFSKPSEILQKAMNISSIQADKLVDGKCEGRVGGYSYHSKLLAESRVLQDSHGIEWNEGELAKIKNWLEAGCNSDDTGYGGTTSSSDMNEPANIPMEYGVAPF